VIEICPSEGVVATPSSSGVSAKSAHADAARKFLAFVLRKDGQAAMPNGESTDFFFVPLVKDVAAKPGRKTDINFIILDDKAAAVATLAAAAALSTTLLGALFAFALRRTNLPFRSFIALTPWLVFLRPDL